LHEEAAMSEWPEFAQWLAIGLGIVFVVTAAVLGVLSWLLNHPRD
jgi:hypothetical protein